MQRKIKISFLIVQYNSQRALYKCLKDLDEVYDIDHCEVIIANNNKESLSIESSYLFQVTIHEMGKNIGFGSANNSIAKYAQGELLFFLNPDIYSMSKRILNIASVLEVPTVGIVAPAILNFKNKVQKYSYGSKITPFSIIKENVAKLIMKDKTKSRNLNHMNNNMSCDWVTGAAFLMRKKDFLEIGGFDEQFFLYFEDIDLCRRVRNLEKTIILCSKYCAMHTSGASSDNMKLKKDIYYRSQDYYISKHHSILWKEFIKFIRKLMVRS